MKKIFTIYLLVMSVFSVLAKEKIVLFELKTQISDKQINFLVNESLTTSIIEAGKYEVLERDQLKSVIRELNLISSDDFTDKEVMKIGELAKASVALVGSLTKRNETYTLNTRIINIETGGSLFAKNITVYDDTELMSAVKDIGYYISGKKTASNLYTRKLSAAIPLLVSGSLLSLGGGGALGGCIYSFIQEEQKYINSPDYESSKYLQVRNGQIAGMVFGSIGIVVGIALISTSIPFFIQANNYKREFSFNLDGDNDSIKIGMGVRF